MVVVVLVYWACVDEVSSVVLPVFFCYFQVQLDFYVCLDVFNHYCVAVGWYSFVLVVIVSVVEGVTYWDSFYYGWGQLCGVFAPLFGRVVFYEGFVDFCAECGEGLFFQIFGGGVVSDSEMFFCFLWVVVSSYFVDGLQVEGECVQLTVVDGFYLVSVVVEGGVLVDVLPDMGAVGVEYVRAVGMDFYAVDGLAVDVTCCVVALVSYEAGVAFVGELSGYDAACQTSSGDYEVFHGVVFYYLAVV